MFLKSLAVLTLPLLPSAMAGGVHFGGKKHKPISNFVGNAGSGGQQGQVGLETKQDMIYIADISIGGNQYPVQLDTGSSDLWVKPTTPPVPNANVTDMSLDLKYGIGSAHGVIARAPVDFAGFTVPNQAILSVSESDNPIFQFGAVGILGLGFTSLSQIDHAVSATGADWGRSYLYNTFVQYPQEPNFIAFLLQRSTDPNFRTEGSFTIGEVEPGYESVMSSTAISTFPIENPTRWTVLFEGYSINGGAQKHLATSAVPNAPKDHGVMLLDSGTSLIYAPEPLVTEIYGSVKGAQFSSSDSMWVLPCDSEIQFSFWIAGVEYPIHPLDMVLDDVVSDGIKDGVCAGSFLPQNLGVGGSEFDILAGDSFLRSVYSVYDFGDFVDGTTKMGNPYVKLMSTINRANASAEFHSVRGGSGLSNAGSGTSSSSSQPSTFTIQDVYDKLQSAIKYAGIALAVVGLGALLLGAACGAAIMAVLSKRKSKREVVGSRTGVLPTSVARAGGNTDSTAFLTTPNTRGSYAPVSLYNEETGRHEYEQPKYSA